MRYSSHAFLTKQVTELKLKRDELRKEVKREARRANKAETLLEKKTEQITKLKLSSKSIDSVVDKLTKELNKAKQVIKEYKSQKPATVHIKKKVDVKPEKLTTYNANYWKARYFEELRRKSR